MVRLSTQCIECLLEKHMKKYPPDVTEEKKLAYMQAALHILSTAKIEQSAPEILDAIVALQQKMFGASEDFSKEKQYFNALMLKKAPAIAQAITEAKDPFALAVGYAMLGNFIDFGAMDSVDENKLSDMLSDAPQMQLNTVEIENLKRDLGKAKHLVYLTDNCGEIVTDKLLIQTIRQLYPDVQIDAIVRGAPVLNDATMEDAQQVNLDAVATVSHNGTAIAGTVLEKITPAACEKIQRADLVIAKGQGNFETMRGCGKNIYYLLCANVLCLQNGSAWSVLHRWC